MATRGWRPCSTRVSAATLLACARVAGSAGAQVLRTDFTTAELKCQNGIATAEGKLLDARAKCIAKCVKSVRAGTTPATDCQGPLFGGDTAACIHDAQKGAEAKAVATIGKGCAADCPECYTGGDCAARATQVVAQVSVGSCVPSAANPDAAECRGKAQEKAVASIDKACTIDRPSCYPAFASTLLPGLATALVESRHTTTWCGS